MKENKLEKNIILGLDLSLVSTGWCLLEDNNILSIGVIKPKIKGIERLNYIRTEISELISQRRESLDLVAIEGYSMGSKGGRAFNIGELGGVIKLLMHKRDIKTIIIPPTSLKKFITGKGNSGKNIMLKETLKKYKIDLSDDNECDAFGLAKMGHSYLEDSTTIKYEKEALQGIDELK